MKKPAYPEIQDGTLTEVPKKWFLACCDCGLVHVFEFSLSRKGSESPQRTLVVKITRDNRKTAAHRRSKGVKVVKTARKLAKKAVK